MDITHIGIQKTRWLKTLQEICLTKVFIELLVF